MTEEIKEEVKNEKRCCYCISEGYKRFLLTILGSFVGCLIALCLYNASVGFPQLPPPPCHRVEFVEFDYNEEIPEFEHQKPAKKFEHKDFEGARKKFHDHKPAVKHEK